MAKVSLAYYTFRISDSTKIDKKTKNPTYIPLGDILGKSLEKHLYNYFYSTAKNYVNDKQNERLFRTIRLNVNEHSVDNELYYKSVTAIVKTGEYGVEAEIVDSEDTSNSTKMSQSQAPVMPFGFALFFNPEKDTAILITQSLGRNGISSVIKKHLSTMVKSIDPLLCSEVKNVIPHNLLKKLLESDEIKSLSIETYKEGNYDLLDEYGEKATLQTSRKVSTFKKPLFSNKNFLYDIFVKQRKISKVDGLTSDDETIDNLIVNFSSKTLNYNAYYSTRITEDISKVFKDEEGVPPLKLFETMDENVREYLYATKIIIPINNCVIKQNNTAYFYVDSEKDDVIEKILIECNK